MKFLIAAVVLAFSFSVFSKPTTHYLLVHHHDEDKREIATWFNTTYDEGRTIILTLKEGVSWSSVPAHIRSILEKIDMAQVKKIRPSALKGKLPVDQKIKELTEQVSLENIRSSIEHMAAKPSRRSGMQGNQQITDWLVQEFTKLDLEVKKECFSPGLCNVVAFKKGEIDEFILVEGHLDSVGKPNAGADDDASGTAGVLEIARLTAKKNSHRGIIYFATNGEESGLLGSKVFVREARSSGLLPKIKFVINMDMIAYNENGLVDIETDGKFEDEAKWMSSLVNTYTSLTPNITMPAWGSDHVPFIRANVPGILTIEHWNTKTPCYHASCDTPDHLNYEYAREIVALNLAATVIKSGIKL